MSDDLPERIRAHIKKRGYHKWPWADDSTALHIEAADRIREQERVIAGERNKVEIVEMNETKLKARIEELEADLEMAREAAAISLHALEIREKLDHHACDARIEELEADLQCTRAAWVRGDDPMCDDVCLTKCQGPCEGTGGRR